MSFYFLDIDFQFYFLKDLSESLQSCGERGMLALLQCLVTRPQILAQERT